MAKFLSFILSFFAKILVRLQPAFRKEGVEYQGVSIGRGMLTPFYTKKLYEFRLEKLQF